jgi:hypothetical protein
MEEEELEENIQITEVEGQEKGRRTITGKKEYLGTGYGG